MKTTQQIADDILRVVHDSAPPPDMLERLTAVQQAIQREVSALRYNLLIVAAMHIQDTQKEHPELDIDSIKRITANELINAASFLVRSLKRKAGGEMEPARFALVAYAIADAILEVTWEDRGEAEVVDKDLPIRSDLHNFRLQHVRDTIKALPEDESIRVECIARTFRNCLEAGGKLGELALELVIEEQQAAAQS